MVAPCPNIHFAAVAAAAPARTAVAAAASVNLSGLLLLHSSIRSALSAEGQIGQPAGYVGLSCSNGSVSRLPSSSRMLLRVRSCCPCAV